MAKKKQATPMPVAAPIDVNSLLTVDALYSWASGLPKGATVGEPDSSEYCPLAHYLDEHTGAYWSVADGLVARRDSVAGTEHNTEPLPAWASRVVHLVDALPGSHVKREQFLQILDQIAEEG